MAGDLRRIRAFKLKERYHCTSAQCILKWFQITLLLYEAGSRITERKTYKTKTLVQSKWRKENTGRNCPRACFKEMENNISCNVPMTGCQQMTDIIAGGDNELEDEEIVKDVHFDYFHGGG